MNETIFHNISETKKYGLLQHNKRDIFFSDSSLRHPFLDSREIGEKQKKEKEKETERVKERKKREKERETAGKERKLKAPLRLFISEYF